MSGSSGAAHNPGPVAQVGAGKGQEPTRPATLAEAEAEYARMVAECQKLAVAAVRQECLRQAQRNLQLDQARLQKPAGPTPAAPAASAKPG